jgi:hypothetical protein
VNKKAAVANYATLGVRIEHVMTDNHSCYRSKAFARICKADIARSTHWKLAPTGRFRRECAGTPPRQVVRLPGRDPARTGRMADPQAHPLP